MEPTIGGASRRKSWRAAWPWVLLLTTFSIALWHAVDFPDDVDPEFPRVARPNFSPLPPPAYRLAEPGDTIDRIAIYVSALAILLALLGLSRAQRDRRRWIAAGSLALASFWHAANPVPTFHGWHGLGWAAMWDASTPMGLRVGLGFAALALTGLVLWGLSGWTARVLVAPISPPCEGGLRGGGPGVIRRLGVLVRNFRDRGATVTPPNPPFARGGKGAPASALVPSSLATPTQGAANSRGVAWLIVTGVILTILRATDWPRIEPLGYWPRWAFVGALMMLCAALLRTMPARVSTRRHTLRLAVVGTACWYGVVVTGIWLTWFHRPLERLRAVTPGKIYISAMPTAQGLEIAQRRIHFKTIINLFPEDTAFRSSRLPDELKFAHEHGIRYVGSPTEVSASNDFLDLTLRLARDPDAWPILVHCHACMDRTPAWAGIYRYVVEGWKLDDVMRFIEEHRGYRPKASVTLLYNRVLARLAPERFKDDPTAALLQRCAEGTVDPYYTQLRAEEARANRKARETVEGGNVSGTAARLPSLTPRR